MECDNKTSRIAILVENVDFSYGKEQKTLNNVSFSINEGDFAAIIGPNGSGKTTLAKLICGLLNPTSGKILVRNKNAYEKKTLIGYVPQISNVATNRKLSVINAVLSEKYSSPIFNYSQADYERAMIALEMVQISGLFRKKTAELFGEQLQKVAFARALVSKADILVLDEPTALIEPTDNSSICSLLKELNESKTIIVTTQNMSAVSSLAKTVAKLDEQTHFSQNRVI